MSTRAWPGTRSSDVAGWVGRARSRTVVLSSLAGVLCVLVMIEWFARSEIFVRPGTTAGAMVFNTALALGLVSASLLAVGRPRRLLAFGALVIGVLVLLEYALDTSLGIDELVVRDWTSPPAAEPPGRPAESSVICATMLSAAVLMLELGWRRTTQVLATVTLAVAGATSFGYLLGVDALYRVGPYTMLPATTTVVVMALSLALLMAVPYGAAQWISFGTDTGSDLQRLLFPLTVVVVPSVGWLVLHGEQRGYFGVSFAFAMMVSVIVGLVLVVGFWVGKHSLSLDSDREQLLSEIHAVNRDLEERVRSRSHQLNRQRTKLALLEERDRIARDLHDRVIQRIFAAGLQVASMSRATGLVKVGDGAPERERVELAEQLDTVAVELDLAIRELRNSIFELTSMGDEDDLDLVVRDIVARASRILGFMPSVEVTGEVAGSHPAMVANLASVIQEGLSNIARHARASSARVELHVAPDTVRLRIIDNGVGLPDPLPRTSGIANLENRAQKLGGSATWECGEDGGTVLTWQARRDPPLAELEAEQEQLRLDQRP